VPPVEFFTTGFWSFATAITLALFGAVTYTVKRSHTLKDQSLIRRDEEATNINQRYISKVEEAAQLQIRLQVEMEARKLNEEKCTKVEWELEATKRELARLDHQGDRQ
jgi:PP-loop superfamily ATP-utilizing enzyme